MDLDRKSPHTVDFDNTDPALAPRLFGTLRRLQRETPVAWTDAVGGYWALTKYDDITRAANDWETFTVEEGHNIPARRWPCGPSPPSWTRPCTPRGAAT
ncbi:hypothetical protein [Nocardioides humi]|uniref:hypothetical protein n=1 Tax=Nocardioides humi TaxID=449461 RepID=UPI00112BC69D|nr:hypothetical protein [Nocardioides humi]